MSGYQATMIREAHAKLMDLRKRMSNAGGLIIAPTIDVANYMADLVSRIQGGKDRWLSIVGSLIQVKESRHFVITTIRGLCR